ncbi:MAG: hypothetical protein MI725_10205 [Pirellulales bacterium]|nr:hypothetical protein [Pirellulales bacterium]
MDTLAIFVLQLVLSLTVFTLIAKWFVAPWLAEKPADLAMIVLVFPHAFRHLGLSFLNPGLVGESLPSYFAYTVAYGDFVSGLLALASLLALKRHWNSAVLLVWLFNIVGTMDLVHALVQESAVHHLGTTWYIPTFWVPVLLVTHAMVFQRLLKCAPRRCANPVQSDVLATQS